MSDAFVVRYVTRHDRADENQKLIENVFAQLAIQTPQDFQYASFRLADGVGFVHLGLSGGAGNPLSELGAFEQFQREFGERVVDGPVASGARLIGSYEFL